VKKVMSERGARLLIVKKSQQINRFDWEAERNKASCLPPFEYCAMTESPPASRLKSFLKERYSCWNLKISPLN
jgi:hypothetical protein